MVGAGFRAQGNQSRGCPTDTLGSLLKLSVPLMTAGRAASSFQLQRVTKWPLLFLSARTLWASQPVARRWLPLGNPLSPE